MLNTALFILSLTMIVLYIRTEKKYNWFIDALFGISVGALAYVISGLIDKAVVWATMI